LRGDEQGRELKEAEREKLERLLGQIKQGR